MPTPVSSAILLPLAALLMTSAIVSDAKCHRGRNKLSLSAEQCLKCSYIDTYCMSDCCIKDEDKPAACREDDGTVSCRMRHPVVGPTFCSKENRTFSSLSMMHYESCLSGKLSGGIKHFGECGKPKDVGPCTKEGLCRYADNGCCCHLFDGVPWCYNEERGWNCHRSKIWQGIGYQGVCASDGKSYVWPQDVLSKSCHSNKVMSIVKFESCNDWGSPNGTSQIGRDD